MSENGLIDEYRFAVNPVLLGGGVPVALPGRAAVDLDLADTRAFRSGIVEMRCVPRSGARLGDAIGSGFAR